MNSLEGGISMKSRVLFAVLFLGLLAGGFALAEQADKPVVPAKKPAAASYDFKSLMQRIWAAWETLDPSKAAPFYSKGADRVFFDIAPLKYTGWPDYAQGVTKVLADYTAAKFALGQDAQAHRRGNFAWGTATWHGELTKKNGGTDTMDGRWTVLWEKRGGDWLIVHEHVSVPLSPPK
jgi:ketosteroid isomerase-like protein